MPQENESQHAGDLLKKEEWEPYAGQDELYIEFLPENILLLNR